MNSRLFYLFSAVTLLGSAAVRAQDLGAQIGTQQDVVRRGEGEVVEQHLQMRLSDPDLGEIDLVSRAPRPKMWTFATEQSFLYTSNAFLERIDEMDDVFWNGRFLASFVPYATRNFTPRLTFEANFFRYGEFSELDFDSQSLTFDMKYDFVRDDSFFGNLSFSAARLDAPHGDNGEFYDYGFLNSSLTYVRSFEEAPFHLASTAGVAWRFGDPADFDRAAGYLVFSLIYSPMETVQLNAFARPELQFYLRDPAAGSRKDYNFSAGATATWTPIEYFSVSATALFTGNASTVQAEDYTVYLPGVILAGRISF